jgi:ketosteroid isomerase-like protein
MPAHLKQEPFVKNPVVLWFATILLGHVAMPQEMARRSGDDRRKGANALEGRTMKSKEENVQVIMQIFRVVEQRDPKGMDELLQPNAEFLWPAPLPYGGTWRPAAPTHPSWGESWVPLQPTEAECRMDPRVVAASEDEVVVLWHQRGKSTNGERFESEVLGLYRFREGKLARAQMFDFDAEGAARFLARATAKATPSQR